jgi:hypothetical protein
MPAAQVPKPAAPIGITLGSLRNVKDAARDRIQSELNKHKAVPIDATNLTEAWKEVVEKIAAEKMLYKSAILESLLSFEGDAITIHANVVAFDYLKSERIRLLDFFKAHYHNEKINVLFAAKVHELEKSGDQVLSTREIFEMMAAKNPNLRILKDKYGMDMEY